MLPALAVLLAALCFATTGTAQALAGVDASTTSIGAARVLIGGGVLGIVALLGRARAGRSGRTARSSAPPRSPISTVTIVAVGALAVVVFQPAFFAGTRANGVAIGTVVALGSAPIMTGALDALVRRRLPTLRWAVATLVALTGVVLVSGVVGAGGGGPLEPSGLAASAGAGLSYSVSAIASKLLLDRGFSAAGAMGAVFGTAAVLSAGVLATTATAWLMTPRGALLALWLGIVTTAIAYSLFGWGLQKLTPTTVATLTLAEPLAATVLGLTVLREQLSPPALIGLVVIAVGLAIVSTPPRTVRDRVAATS